MTGTVRSETGFAPIYGAQLYYEVTGDGDALVFVHAGIADSRMWDDQFAVFAEHYRVVRYDMRGFGQSEPVPGEFSFSTNLHGLLNHLGISQAHLIGCSMGGSACIDFVLQHPDMATALVPVCSAPSGMEDGDVSELPPLIHDLIAAHQAGDVDRMNDIEVQLWVDGLYRSPEQVDVRVRERVREMNKIALNNATVVKGTEQPLEPPAVERLGQITVPTLVVVGDLDLPPTQQAATLMLERVSGSQQAVIENTAHLPNMERPDEFNRIVLNFLRAL